MHVTQSNMLQSSKIETVHASTKKAQCQKQIKSPKFISGDVSIEHNSPQVINLTTASNSYFSIQNSVLVRNVTLRNKLQRKHWQIVTHKIGHPT